MRVAFYAPMKPPDDPVPSGDRRMAGLLLQALEAAGHEAEVASRLRSREAEGDRVRQAALRDQGRAEADALIARYRTGRAEAWPAAWLTYHLYYKAPDWIGPRVCAALDIPYLVAEASVAPKRAGGPWDLGHRATLAALAQATAAITLNPADADCLPDPGIVRPLPPFLDATPFLDAAEARAQHRAHLARQLDLDPERPWLLAVGMMRAGDKLASYRLLADALQGVSHLSWDLVIVGDGPARDEVRRAFGGLDPARLRWRGQQATDALRPLYAACDLMVWPAINEAYGMALLEAQASGLPVVAGRVGGVPAVVGDGESGLLTTPGDLNAFATALKALLTDEARRQVFARRALQRVQADHDLNIAAGRLDAILREATASRDPAIAAKAGS